MTYFVDSIANLVMLAMQLAKGFLNRFPIPGIRGSTSYERSLDPFNNREEYLLHFLQVGRHIRSNLIKNGRYPDHFRVVGTMDIGYFSTIGGDLFVILLEIRMVGIVDIVDEKRQRPRCIVLTPVDRFILHCSQFACYRGKIEIFFCADCAECNLAATAEIDAVLFKNPGGTEIGRDNLADGFIS